MKQFAKETNSSVAHDLLEVVPLVMRFIRAQMRGNRQAGLSVPQFRTLAFISRHVGASLSAIADHLGLTLPSASKLVDGLVAQDLVVRCDSMQDRRRMALNLTPRGAAMLAAAQEATLARLANSLATLPDTEQAGIAAAMQTLRRVFGNSENPPKE